MKSQYAVEVMFVGVFALCMSCEASTSDDPLTGTWSNDNCFGVSSMPDDIEACNTELSFNSGLDVELKVEWVSKAATANYAGCTTTRLVTGQTWSTDGSTFTVSGDGVATSERTGCVNDADNSSPAKVSGIAIPSGDTSYTLSGDSLTVGSGALKGAYTR